MVKWNDKKGTVGNLNGGTIEVNDGSVTFAFGGLIKNNTDSGTVGWNYAHIERNYGKIDRNFTAGTIDYNYGTVSKNEGGQVIGGTVEEMVKGKVYDATISAMMDGEAFGCDITTMNQGTATHCNITTMNQGTATNCNITTMYGGEAVGGTIENCYGAAFNENTTVKNAYYEYTVSDNTDFYVNAEGKIELEGKPFIRSNGTITLTAKDGYVFVDAPTAPGATVNTIVEGNKYEITGFTQKTDVTATCGIIIPNTNSYPVTFDAKGGTPAPETQNVRYNQKATVPPEPTKEGYDFLGWFYNNKVFYFNTPITQSMELKAKWAKAIHEITFDADGGDFTPPKQEIAPKGFAEKPDIDPKRLGYEFLGWYNGDNLFDFETQMTSSVPLKAKWKRTNIFDVSGMKDQGKNTTWVLALYDDKTLIESEVVSGEKDRLSISSTNIDKDGTLFLLGENHELLFCESFTGASAA